jgi:hypothetical protein
VNLVDLAVPVAFALQEFGHFLGREPYPGVIAEVENIQAPVSIRFFKLWQFHRPSFYGIAAGPARSFFPGSPLKHNGPKALRQYPLNPARVPGKGARVVIVRFPLVAVIAAGDATAWA